MKILHIMKDYKPRSGGSVVRNGSMIDTYNKLFDDKIYLINLDGDKYSSYSVESDVEIYRCTSLIMLIRKAIKIIKDFSIDVIQTHNFRFLAVGLIAKKLSFRKCTLSVELHAIYEMNKWKEWISYKLLKKADMIIVLSESAKSYLVQTKKIDKTKITVLRNGIGKDSIISKNCSLTDKIKSMHEHYCVMAYTGSFIDWQGVGFLSDNFDILLDSYPNLFIVMIGDGPDYDYVVNKYGSAKNSSRILISKSVSKPEINSIFPYIDIIVIPRQKNLCTNTAVPLKAIESMQQGKCIIASNDNGLTELLNNNDARIFEAYNVKSLISQLKDIVNDEHLRNQLGANANQVACKKLNTWEYNASILHEKYCRLREENK